MAAQIVYIVRRIIIRVFIKNEIPVGCQNNVKKGLIIETGKSRVYEFGKFHFS